MTISAAPEGIDEGLKGLRRDFLGGCKLFHLLTQLVQPLPESFIPFSPFASLVAHLLHAQADGAP